MRLALVSDWFLPRLGGIELHMRELAVRLQARGHQVEVVTPIPGPGLVDGIRVHRLGVPRVPGAGIVFTRGAFRRLREVLKNGRYDAVHVHFGIIAPVAWGATRISHTLGIPALATFHSVLRHFEMPLVMARGAGAHKWRVRWSAVSSVVAESVRPLTADGPVAILPNGVDARWWSCAKRRTYDRGPRRVTAVSVMRLHRRKRPYALLDAVAAVAAELPPDRQLALRLIGDGIERKSIERAISRKGLDGIVTMRGWLPPDAVREELHAADVFVLPSRLEAFGIAALEARCAGLPCVAMAAAGVRDFLAHGHDALLAASDAEFARHLRAVVLDDALSRRLGEACATPPMVADWPVVLGRHEALIREAAAIVPNAMRDADG